MSSGIDLGSNLIAERVPISAWVRRTIFLLTESIYMPILQIAGHSNLGASLEGGGRKP